MLGRFDRLVRKRPSASSGGRKARSRGSALGSEGSPQAPDASPAGRLHPPAGSRRPECPGRPPPRRRTGPERPPLSPFRLGLRGEPGQAPLLREPAGPAPSPPRGPEGPAEDGTALVSRLQRRPGARPARGGRAPLAPGERPHTASAYAVTSPDPPPGLSSTTDPPKARPRPSHGVSRGAREGAPLTPEHLQRRGGGGPVSAACSRDARSTRGVSTAARPALPPSGAAALPGAALTPRAFLGGRGGGRAPTLLTSGLPRRLRWGASPDSAHARAFLGGRGGERTPTLLTPGPSSWAAAGGEPRLCSRPGLPRRLRWGASPDTAHARAFLGGRGGGRAPTLLTPGPSSWAAAGGEPRLCSRRAFLGGCGGERAPTLLTPGPSSEAAAGGEPRLCSRPGLPRRPRRGTNPDTAHARAFLVGRGGGRAPTLLTPGPSSEAAAGGEPRHCSRPGLPRRPRREASPDTAHARAFLVGRGGGRAPTLLTSGLPRGPRWGTSPDSAHARAFLGGRGGERAPTLLTPGPSSWAAAGGEPRLCSRPGLPRRPRREASPDTAHARAFLGGRGGRRAPTLLTPGPSSWAAAGGEPRHCSRRAFLGGCGGERAPTLLTLGPSSEAAAGGEPRLCSRPGLPRRLRFTPSEPGLGLREGRVFALRGINQNAYSVIFYREKPSPPSAGRAPAGGPSARLSRLEGRLCAGPERDADPHLGAIISLSLQAEAELHAESGPGGNRGGGDERVVQGCSLASAGPSRPGRRWAARRQSNIPARAEHSRVLSEPTPCP
ncbi:collagen alpha-1(I) chain-like [Muntiacus reevesi]|uniref:collagen alpha-1(I) chain-like n=1 Tax=Muntiacus reevesi TaxID=9886 RepID=UPI003306F9B4